MCLIFNTSMYMHGLHASNKLKAHSDLITPLTYSVKGIIKLTCSVKNRGGNSCSSVKFVLYQLMSIRIYGSILIRHVY